MSSSDHIVVKCHLVNSLKNHTGISWTIQCEIQNERMSLFLRIIHTDEIYSKTYGFPDKKFTMFENDESKQFITIKKEMSNVKCYLDEMIREYLSLNPDDFFSKAQFEAIPCFSKTDENSFFYYDILNYHFPNK